MLVYANIVHLYQGEGEKFTLYLGSVKVYKILVKFQLVLNLLADKSSQSTSLELCVG